MAQHDYVIDNSTGANVRADINNVLQAIATNNSPVGAGHTNPPSTTFATSWFADVDAGIMKLRNTANTDYVNLFTLAGGIDVDAASNFNEDVTFTGASANMQWDKSDSCLEFADNAKAKFGGGDDLDIYHDGTDSYIRDQGDGDLYIRGDNFINIQNAAGTKNKAKFISNSAVELYFDNDKKLETTTLGTKIIGDLFLDNPDHAGSDVQFDSSAKKMKFDDGVSANFGSGDDLQISHDGSNSFVLNTGGQLLLRSTTGVQLGAPSGEPYVIGAENGAVSLYFDNEVKAATITDGFAVTNKLLIYDSAGANSNMKMSFRASISASSSQTFQAGSVFAMGTVTVFGSRGAGANNATIATGVIHPIHIRGTSTAELGSAISGLNGSGGSFSYSVTGASKGITITNNNSTFAVNVMVHFDLTGFVG